MRALSLHFFYAGFFKLIGLAYQDAVFRLIGLLTKLKEVLIRANLDVFVKICALKSPSVFGFCTQSGLMSLTVGLTLFLSNLSVVVASELQESQGFYQALIHENINDALFLRDARLSVGGWASAGANFNPDHPDDRSNAPVSFNYRANEFNLEQLNLFVDRQVLTNADKWDVGGRFDVMFGLDTPYTQATGHWDQHLIDDNDLRLYKMALPQLYAEVYAPIANGISAKFGRFYSIIGYESVSSPANFFLLPFL